MKISNKQLQFPIRSCRRSKTSSFAATAAGEAKDNDGDAVTLSDIDQFLFENFRSLYPDGRKSGEAPKTTPFLFESPRLLEIPPPPENLCGSARFFVAAGSSSSLIVDDPPSSTSSADSSSSSSAAANGGSSASDGSSPAAAPDDFIALLTYSPSPYEDFRRSMQEMVDARAEHNGRVDWEFLEELLFCYLDLNNKKAYRYILRAFVDLIVGLRENSGRVPAARPSLGGGGWRRRLI
uniref:Transcription repressor n=1 Tax=Striga hermonthica TaxID=68872 RepID=A0A9N7NN36_STRHE|nr:Transcription repressor OFP14 [Striga hermonthica]